MPDQVALSYSKFDHIVDSDDEDNESKARDALLIDKKQRHHFERDAELTQRFTAHLREHLKSKYPVAHRKLVARFIAISDRGAERSNVYRYSDMTALIQQRTAELLQRSSITMLCELHKALLEGIKDPENKESAQATEARTVMEAINTLEACLTEGAPTKLFEALCSPSSSDAAFKLRERYEKQEYAKQALMRHLFGDKEFEEFSKGRDGGSSEPFFDGEFCQAICVIIAFVVALLGLIFYLLWRVRSTGAGETATGPIHALLQLAKVIFPDEPDGDGEGIPYPVGGAYEEHARQEFEQYEAGGAALKDEA